MSYELTVAIGNHPYKVFLQDGFYQYRSKPGTGHMLHMHNYPEIHIVCGGSMLLAEGESQKTIASGSVFIVPPRSFHGCISKEETTLHSAFQIDCPCTEFALHSAPEALPEAFFRLLAQTDPKSDHAELASFLSILAAPFLHCEPLLAQRIGNYDFLIHEFFIHRYHEDLHLADLAEELHLSERQTERLVLEHTGHTFREELTRIRLLMADRLLATTGLSLAEIAQYVGYRSYAGFWKAMKKR